jgi:hypothetical protein
VDGLGCEFSSFKPSEMTSMLINLSTTTPSLSTQSTTTNLRNLSRSKPQFHFLFSYPRLDSQSSMSDVSSVTQ